MCLRLPALLALIGALAGCGDLPRPFQPEAKSMPVVRPVSPEAAAMLREPVMVAVQPVTNLPAEGGPRLAAAMAVALRNEGVAADIDPRGVSYTLAAIANVRELPLELEIKVTWFLLDPKGFRLAQLEQITRGRVEDWMEGNDRLISRIAQNQAPPVAAMINLHTARATTSQRATTPVQGPPPNGMAPPTGSFSPQAQGGLRPPPPEKPTARDRATLKADASKPVPPPAAAPSPTAPAPQAVPQQAAAAPAGKPQAVRIVVPRVDGAPGDGPDSLAAGMKRALGNRNFAIVQKAEVNSLTVRGKVDLKPFNNGRETITITWTVLDAQNNQVGEIEQSNVIPAGSLNGAWGPIAREITVAAAEGLLDLLDKASKAARQ